MARTVGFSLSFVSLVDFLYFEIRISGVRQGCPLSPLLYLTSIGISATNLRAHPDIAGLRLPGFPNPFPGLSLYDEVS